jgi:hypothetical protein
MAVLEREKFFLEKLLLISKMTKYQSDTVLPKGKNETTKTFVTAKFLLQAPFFLFNFLS